MSAATDKKLYPVRFVWDHGGHKVFVCLTTPAASGGESRTIELHKQPEGHHETLVALTIGRFEYR
jgi:hypothetical protein